MGSREERRERAPLPTTDEERLDYVRAALQGILKGAVESGLHVPDRASVLALYGTLMSAIRTAYHHEDQHAAFRDEIKRADFVIVYPDLN